MLSSSGCKFVESSYFCASLASSGARCFCRHQCSMHQQQDVWLPQESRCVWCVFFTSPPVFPQQMKSQRRYDVIHAHLGWFELLTLILEGAIITAESLEQGEAVLVHCSDGWDRTSQALLPLCTQRTPPGLTDWMRATSDLCAGAVVARPVLPDYGGFRHARGQRLLRFWTLLPQTQPHELQVPFLFVFVLHARDCSLSIICARLMAGRTPLFFSSSWTLCTK